MDRDKSRKSDLAQTRKNRKDPLGPHKQVFSLEPGLGQVEVSGQVGGRRKKFLLSGILDYRFRQERLDQFHDTFYRTMALVFFLVFIDIALRFYVFRFKSSSESVFVGFVFLITAYFGDHMYVKKERVERFRRAVFVASITYLVSLISIDLVSFRSMGLGLTASTTAAVALVTPRLVMFVALISGKSSGCLWRVGLRCVPWGCLSKAQAGLGP